MQIKKMEAGYGLYFYAERPGLTRTWSPLENSLPED